MRPGYGRRIAVAAVAWITPATVLAQQPGSALPPPPPTMIGINVPAIGYGASNVPFANLAIGSPWLDAHWANVPEANQNDRGDLLSLPAGNWAHRFISVPPTGPAGIEVRCTWAGSGNVGLGGGGTVLASSRDSLRFRIVKRHGDVINPYLVVKEVDPQRPFHAVDCREATLPPTALFRPAFLATLKGFRVLRFMDWQNANANEAVTWAGRHLPDGNRSDHDGIPIETMLALAREVGADPWFVVPWNADPAYVAGFARLVRDQLPAGRRVYVEVGNEVWNQGFSVGKQALKEGVAMRLGSDAQLPAMRRYAQKTGEVMRVWEAAFAGRSGLVRVISTQQGWPDTARAALSYQDTAKHVDALSTSYYFGGTYGGTDNTREGVLAKLTADIPVALAAVRENRRIALSYGKRFIAYEGGEGVALPAQPALQVQLQHDPAQYAIVQRALAGWRQEIGDVLCLLTSVSLPGPWGSWGLAVYEDETPEEAPKLRAVRDAMARP